MARKVNPRTPFENKPKVSEPKSAAGGLSAIGSAVRFSLRDMSMVESIRALGKVNQKNGFDCPGCAWPDPADRSALGEFCENGAKAVGEEAISKSIPNDFFSQHSVTSLSKQSDRWLGKQGRLIHPLVLSKGSDHYELISWEDAFGLIANHLNALKNPNEAIFYTSGRTSNEAAFLYQLFVREFGTNNLPDCSNMCHESSGAALGETLGIGKGSVTLKDFEETELIIIMGQNPGTNHPRMLTSLQKAKRNGAKIITVNPIKEAGLLRFSHPQSPSDLISGGEKLTDLYLQIRINEDVPLLKAINISLLQAADRGEEVLDQSFIETNTTGFDSFRNDLRVQNVQDLISRTGVTENDFEEALKLIKSSSKIIVCWAMGLTQHKNGVDNIKEIVNLLLLKGSIGKPGSGTCPVRGHSNVQGDRTMGIWEAPKPAFLKKLKDVFNFNPPQEHGYNTVQSIKAMADGKAEVFFALGGNFLSATPDTDFTAKALQHCKLTVQVSTKLNRSHLITGDTALILPCLGRTEIDMQSGERQFVTVENSAGVVHQSSGVLQPHDPDLRSEPWIIANLATKVLGGRSQVNWLELAGNYDLIRDKIEAVIPGFENFNQRVRKPGGFELPNVARDRKFRAWDGKAAFSITQGPDHDLKEDEFLMMTIRSHDQFNTTIYGLNDRYRGIKDGRRVVFMNADDMRERDIKKGTALNLSSNYSGIVRTANRFYAVPYDIPSRCIATYFPEANSLIPWNEYARTSETPVSKSVIVQIT